jgi:hypothetical protein
MSGPVRFLLFVILPITIAAQDYKNPRSPIDQRVTDLLGRMTLE